METIEYETPKNKDDVKAMYEALSSVLISKSRPSHELGYLNRLYTGAVLYEQAKRFGVINEFKD